MRHKIAAATAATVAVGVATMLMAVVAPSAGAAEIEKARSTPGSDCPVNAVCLYTEKKYRGTVLVDRGAKGRNSYGNANDTFESIINRTGEDVCFFRDEDFQGPKLPLHHDKAFSDLQAYADALSSHQRC